MGLCRNVYGSLNLLVVLSALFWVGACGKAETENNDLLSPEIKEAMSTPPFNHGHWGLLVVGADTGETIYSTGLDRKYDTGSTAKVFSVGTLMDVLGADHRFKTSVRGQADANGTVAGDLILVAQGDLTLGGRTDEKGEIAVQHFDHTDANALPGVAALTKQNPLAGLEYLAQQLVAKGIKNIQGNVLVDDRLWDPFQFEGLPISPIVVNDNLIDLIFTPTTVGNPAGFDWRPRTAAFTFKSNVTTGPAGSEIVFQATAEGTVVTVSGSVPLGLEIVPLIQTWQIPEPGAFARTLLIEALERAGVAVSATTTGPNPVSQLPTSDVVAGLPLLAELVSPPLAEEAKLILKISHNMGANTLPLLLAVNHGNRTFAEGMAAEKEFVAKAIGMAASDLSLNDGSGGDDQVYPQTQVAWLAYLTKRPFFDKFLAALPILGVDGSLSTVAVDSPAAGHVYAKTGTLLVGDENGVLTLKTKALAGYIDAASGRKLIYVVYLNDVAVTSVYDVFAANDVLGRISELIQQAQ